MLITKVNRRYAKSLLDLAAERNELEKLRQDADYLVSLVVGSRDFRNMLKSPVISPDRKEKVLRAILEESLAELTMQFIIILVRKGRENQLEETFRAFQDLHREHMGIEMVVITTAHPLSDEQREEIAAKLREYTNGEVEVKAQVHPDQLGGLKIRVGDRQYNGSIAARLEQLSRSFSVNQFEPKI